MHRSTLVLFVLPALAVAQTLVLIGGNLKDDNTPIWKRMVEVAGGVGNAKIGVISATNGVNSEVSKVIENFVRVYGANSAISIRINPDNANSQEIMDEITQQTGIFLVESTESPVVVDFVLHDVSSEERKNFIETLRPSGVDSQALSAIKAVLANGGMIAGNGAIMGKSATILGGDSLSALVMNTPYQELVSPPQAPLQYSTTGGLGLLEGYVIDSHFSEKGREVRLIRTLLETKDTTYTGVSKGFGIDENTALFVSSPVTRPAGKVITADFSVSGIFFTDVSKISSNQILEANYQNIPFSFYTLNDTIELPSEHVTFAPWKVSIAGEEWFQDAIPSSDILSQENSSEWRKTARRLIDCKELNVTSFSADSHQPKVRVLMDRTQAVGYGADIPDDPNKTYLASFYDMLVSVEVVTN